MVDVAHMSGGACGAYVCCVVLASVTSCHMCGGGDDVDDLSAIKLSQRCNKVCLDSYCKL